MPEKDFKILSTLPLPEEYQEREEEHPLVRHWIEFDTALRNELVRTRAARIRRDPAAYSLAGIYGDSSLGPAVMAAGTNSSLSGAEKALDELRWKKLDDLATGHYFDLDFLITFGYKLMILERWERIRTADGRILLEQVLAGGTAIQ
ncbi:MAG: DUF2764 domain-containing protein [Methanoregulaceae archaeon]|nr:DUF2764 domain-containing protein [Methanoregulaceae archaeon]